MSMNGSEGVPQAFLRLEDLLLTPPLPALVAALIVLGTLYLSRRLARQLSVASPTPLELAGAFMLTTGVIAALVHALAWAGYASVTGLRVGGWVLASMGVLELSSWRFAESTRVIREYFREGSLTERCALILAIITVIGLFAAALGPAVDADSLNYHLGVPLDWLRHGRAYPRPDWFHARFVGLGESINMLGLAAGTDGLGAAFQAAGLIIALVGVTAFAETRADRLFGVLLVVTCPVIFLLISGQKPQLLPSAGLVIALIIVVQRFENFDPLAAVFAFGCAAFAMASKHSFLLTGGVVVSVGLIAAFRTQRLRFALMVLAGCFAIFAAPVFARNFVFYGDPISPMLERWRPGGDPAVIAFAEQSLRSYLASGPTPVTLATLARLPWDLAVTLHPGAFHHVLGLGVFGFLLALRERGSARLLLLTALPAFALVFAFAQLNHGPRFFLDPYLWCAAAAAAVPWSSLKSLFFKALTAQALAVALVAIYLGVIFFRGALTEAGRERVMTLMALGYAEAKWLDATLPTDAVVLTTAHNYSMLPRPFVVADRFRVPPSPSRRSETALFDWKQQLTEFVREKRVTVLVTEYPIEIPVFSWLATRYGTPLAEPAQFRFAARSPFNRGDLVSSVAIRLNLDPPGSPPE